MSDYSIFKELFTPKQLLFDVRKAFQIYVPSPNAVLGAVLQPVFTDLQKNFLFFSLRQ